MGCPADDDAAGAPAKTEEGAAAEDMLRFAGHWGSSWDEEVVGYRKTP